MDLQLPHLALSDNVVHSEPERMINGTEHTEMSLAESQDIIDREKAMPTERRRNKHTLQ